MIEFPSLFFRKILCINYIQINPFVNPSFNIERTTQREIPETTSTTSAPRTTTKIPFSREDDRRINLALKTSSSKSSNSNKKLDSDQRDQRNESKKQSKSKKGSKSKSKNQKGKKNQIKQEVGLKRWRSA